jgi:membrane protein implicated in regulation of membrane protease activity
MLMYLLLRLVYEQQSSSLVSTRSAVGCTGSVTVTIGENSPGEVGLYLDGAYRTFSASSSDGKPVNKGENVLVLNNEGSHLVVERSL